MRRVKSLLTPFTVAVMALSPLWGSSEVIGQANGSGTQILQGGAVVDPDAKAGDATRPPLRSTAEKRRWLRDQLSNGVTSKRELMPLLRKVDHLTPQQVDVLTNAVLAQQLPLADQQQMQHFDLQQQQLLQQTHQELARLRFIRQALENELWLRNAGHGVGYMPVITWLPEGTWFGAAANISPDGRYARINANPFYSNVGPVYNYNLNTGRTQPWMPQSGSQANQRPLGSPGYDHAEVYGGSQTRHQPQATPPAQPRVWHDGIRTRVSP